MNALDLNLIHAMMERRRAEAARANGHRPRRVGNPPPRRRLSWRLGRRLVKWGRALEGRDQTAAPTRDMPSKLVKIVS